MAAIIDYSKLSYMIQFKHGIKQLNVFLLVALSFIACNKNKLDVKPNQAMLVPTTVEDFQALLDQSTMNINYPVIGEAGTDNYYILYTRFNSLPFDYMRNIYKWSKEIFYAGDYIVDWSYPYNRIYFSNIVMEGMEKLDNKQSPEYKSVFGSALFFRASSYYSLVLHFCKPYDISASNELGIPIKRTADISEVSYRPNLAEVYSVIVNDLKNATKILPDTSAYNTRPSKAAGYALLARCLMDMDDYEQAFLYSDSALKLKSQLIDYNAINPNNAFPFPLFNVEVIFQAQLAVNNLISATNTSVDSVLYKAYNDDDLRKTLFFKKQPNGLVTFRGSYMGSAEYFGGIATDELFFIRSECYARKNLIAEAMNDLTTVMRNRWRSTVAFPIFKATTALDAIKLITEEKRKELVFRGVRWADLRRLNKEPALSKSLSRIVAGITYVLPPNDLRYTYPIPTDEIILSGIPQNSR